MNDAILISGNQLYQERARLTLPYIVKQAQIGETIFYSDLAKKIGIKNARHFDKILGFIGTAMQALGKKYKMEIPKIQCIVISKTDHLPGAGIGWFLDHKDDFKKLNKDQKRNFLDRQLFEIYNYKKWDWILEKLELEPVKVNVKNEIEEIKQTGYGGGESKEHKKFKEFIAENPLLVGINDKIINRSIEYKLPSSDEIDVLFEIPGKLIGVEVKSIKSDEKDILRGIFQCVKYKALLEAEQKVTKNIETDCYLAIQGKLTNKLRNVAFILKVNVIDSVENQPVTAHKRNLGILVS